MSKAIKAVANAILAGSQDLSKIKPGVVFRSEDPDWAGSLNYVKEAHNSVYHIISIHPKTPEKVFSEWIQAEDLPRIVPGSVRKYKPNTDPDFNGSPEEVDTSKADIAKWRSMGFRDVHHGPEKKGARILIEVEGPEPPEGVHLTEHYPSAREWFRKQSGMNESWITDIGFLKWSQTYLYYLSIPKKQYEKLMGSITASVTAAKEIDYYVLGNWEDAAGKKDYFWVGPFGSANEAKANFKRVAQNNYPRGLNSHYFTGDCKVFNSWESLNAGIKKLGAITVRRMATPEPDFDASITAAPTGELQRLVKALEKAGCDSVESNGPSWDDPVASFTRPKRDQLDHIVNVVAKELGGTVVRLGPYKHYINMPGGSNGKGYSYAFDWNDESEPGTSGVYNCAGQVS